MALCRLRALHHPVGLGVGPCRAYEHCRCVADDHEHLLLQLGGEACENAGRVAMGCGPVIIQPSGGGGGLGLTPPALCGTRGSGSSSSKPGTREAAAKPQVLSSINAPEAPSPKKGRNCGAVAHP